MSALQTRKADAGRPAVRWRVSEDLPLPLTPRRMKTAGEPSAGNRRDVMGAAMGASFDLDKRDLV